MNLPFADILATLDRMPALAEDLLRQSADPAQRASLVTAMLRSVWPGLPLYACCLREGSDCHVQVVDESGSNRPEWVKKLAKELTPRDKKSNRERRPSARSLQALKLPDHLLSVRSLTFREHRYGTLALALPKTAAPEAVAVGHALLAMCGDQLATRLYLEVQDYERQTLQEELTWLANLGELTSPLMHEFNNFLNNLLLHVAVLELEVAEHTRSELTKIRRQGANFTVLTKQLQQHRKRRPSTLPLSDLNRQVREAVESLSRAQIEPGLGPRIKPAPSVIRDGADQAALGEVLVHQVLAPDLSPVLGSASDLKRLLSFLLLNAAAALASGAGTITVRTEQATDKVLLHVEDTGPSIAPELLYQLFEPSLIVREGTNSLELAACQSLAKRLQGSIQGANRAEGGVTITVELAVQPG